MPTNPLPVTKSKVMQKRNKLMKLSLMLNKKNKVHQRQKRRIKVANRLQRLKSQSYLLRRKRQSRNIMKLASYRSMRKLKNQSRLQKAKI